MNLDFSLSVQLLIACTFFERILFQHIFHQVCFSFEIGCSSTKRLCVGRHFVTGTGMAIHSVTIWDLSGIMDV